MHIPKLKLINFCMTILVVMNSCGDKGGGSSGSKQSSEDTARSLLASYFDASTYYMTLPDFQISQIPISMGGPVKIGRGVKLLNPNNPILQNDQLIEFKYAQVTNNKTNTAFATNNNQYLADTLPKTEIPISDIKKTTTWDFFEGKSETEKARALYANFSYDALFGSFDASYSYVSKFKSSGVFLMAMATETITDFKMPTQTNIIPSVVSNLKRIDKLENEVERLSKMLDNYGSHYISEVTYGYRITFIASTETTSKEVQQNASLQFNNMVASVSITGSMRDYFINNNIKRAATIIGGYGSPSIYLRSIDEIKTFFDKLNAGTIKMYYAPVACRLKSYSHAIYSDQYPKIFQFLQPNLGDRAKSDYGVPRGTVIAWSPLDYETLKQDTIDINSLIPKGWALCDGNNSTPNLRDRFIYGTVNTEEIRNSGGQLTHQHTGTTSESAPRGGPKGDNVTFTEYHKHTFTTDQSEHLPPYVKLVYIIKL